MSIEQFKHTHIIYGYFYMEKAALPYLQEANYIYVVDSSFFPSIGAMNPKFTIVANASRIAEDLIQKLDASWKSLIFAINTLVEVFRSF
ncbi:MAG: hypothetical protein HC836_03440 [Richelia sp. RM2_1_2]|nr:hypothetical protein [Richelia sp. SM1_7_0]NJN07415.1 hypothetical protein [Richelia sp. RM1_1_1]NJO26785.1 hypothetical protein [Richelia sp. SL_2_1]NJO57460.1 hypothetical protein [Richelia sp. RM2_1_2]